MLPFRVDMHEGISDEEAVARVKTGDTSCYEVLAARHGRHLERLARKYLRNDADAEDAVQDAHLLAFTRIDQFAERSSFVAWISAITVNQALMRLRKNRGVFVTGEVQFDAFPSNMRSPELETISRDLGEHVSQALAGLPASYRSVFLLREGQSLDTAETGCRLGLTQACVKTRLRRAKQMLQRRMRAKQAVAMAA
jgi:RNA polymerase sigma-70 factor (ECF subfamily)